MTETGGRTSNTPRLARSVVSSCWLNSPGRGPTKLISPLSTFQNNNNTKLEQLEQFHKDTTNKTLTTNTNIHITNNQNNLHTNKHNPTLMEDFIMHKKLTHFDHEHIPKRMVHARGSTAHDYFKITNPTTNLTCANFLSEAGKRTPVFVHFSTVQGPHGSADTIHDVRNFTMKFTNNQNNLHTNKQ